MEHKSDSSLAKFESHSHPEQWSTEDMDLVDKCLAQMAHYLKAMKRRNAQVQGRLNARIRALSDIYHHVRPHLWLDATTLGHVDLGKFQFHRSHFHPSLEMCVAHGEAKFLGGGVSPEARPAILPWFQHMLNAARLEASDPFADGSALGERLLQLVDILLGYFKHASAPDSDP